MIHEMARPARQRVPRAAARQSPVLYAIPIAAAAIVSYSNSLSNPLVFDDRVAIVENAAIRSVGASLTPGRETPLAGRPMVALSFALNHRAGGLEVAGYRVTNIAIHACTALLLFGVVRRTLQIPAVRDRFGAGAEGIAPAIALLWAVHPLNSEAVDYATQRTESLMALMAMLTLYASIRALTGVSRTRWQSAAVVSCALGMACKES